MKNKKSRAVFCWFPFVNPSGLDYSTQAVTVAIAHSLRRSQTGIAIATVRPHSQEEASDV